MAGEGKERLIQLHSTRLFALLNEQIVMFSIALIKNIYLVSLYEISTQHPIDFKQTTSAAHRWTTRGNNDHV